MATRRYTQLPCGLRLRLDVESGDFDFKGDIGQSCGEPIVSLSLSIDTNPENLMALSAFFLNKARESHEQDQGVGPNE